MQLMEAQPRRLYTALDGGAPITRGPAAVFEVLRRIGSSIERGSSISASVDAPRELWMHEAVSSVAAKVP